MLHLVREPARRSRLSLSVLLVAVALAVPGGRAGAVDNPGDVRNCGDFATWPEANAWFWTYFPEHGDIAHLDSDGDQIPCESLPGAPTQPAPPPTSPPPSTPGPPPTRIAPPTQPGTCPRGGAPTPPPAQVGAGYWMLEDDGQVHGFGDADRLEPGVCQPSVDLAAAPGGRYWILTPNGKVHAAGGAPHHGQLDPGVLADGEQAATLAPLPNGGGYWIFTNYGRAFPFGAAVHHGDLTDIPLNGPIIASQATPTGRGYYMIGTDGGVFTFGDARFAGSTGDLILNQPVVGIAPDPDNTGYWLIAADGGVFAFDAPYRGSVPAVLPPGGRLNQPIIGGLAYGNGYLMVASDGGIFSFSTTPFLGSLGDNPPPNPIVAVAVATPPTPGPAETLAGLPRTPAFPPGGYNRDLFPTWRDLDGDGCDAREQTLLEESVIPPTIDPATCEVLAGRWWSSYDDVWITDPSQLDIDHLVPLAEAWRSGAWAWTADQRLAYANDTSNWQTLTAVTATSNRSKSDSDPSEWRPTNSSTWCAYATAWIEVKATWQLSVDEIEAIRLSEMLATC